MFKNILLITAIALSAPAFSQVHAEYTGKIKSMYIHDRDSDPYFGIELVGEMNANPCGEAKKYFIINPSDINEHHYSMLLAAYMAGKTVKIANQDAANNKRCHGAYPQFNLVKVL